MIDNKKSVYNTIMLIFVGTYILFLNILVILLLFFLFSGGGIIK